ncbi:MAG TPA: GNAT family N-acetyltransferase [Micromonosporaceae bacterium]|jgi:hypothetical protein|nr:GNAT family N-acetyltransferase [Micromonosporaceae bacterium]
MDIEVVDAPEAHRFEARVDGAVAGFVDYRDRRDAIELVHTEVSPAFEGHGVGSALVRQVLDDFRSRGVATIPTCPFVTEFIRRHREYLDVVVPRGRAKFDTD